MILAQTLIASSRASAGDIITATIQISEIRIDQIADDNDEYFELAGDPNASLDGLTYIVIGDGTGGSGVIENVTSLGSTTIPGDGYFVAAKSEYTLGTKDLTAALVFENSDNVTHMLVAGFTGSLAQDLDTNDDGTLDTTPWTGIADSVSVLNTASGGERVYSATTIGPDTEGAPWHIVRCNPTWFIGSSATTGDSPGAANALCADGDDPTPAISFPQPDTPLSPSGYDAGCADATPDVCGTASDTGGSGLSKVEVRIQRASDNYYWNGTSWQAGEAWNLATGTAAWSYGFDPDPGVYTLTARASDIVGNAAQTSVSFDVDATPPNTTILTGPDGTVYTRSATFNFESPDDENATFECSLDGELFDDCNPGLTFNNLSRDEHTFAVRAVDLAGNVDPDPASRVWTVAAPQPKNVVLKASRNPVPKGTKVRLTATVSPCAGHANDNVKFQKLVDGNWKTFATVPSNDNCKATKRVRMQKKTTFRAVSPKQDADHLAGASERLTVRVKD